MPDDLSIIAFRALRQRFFRADGEPIDFDLPDKKNTQDDPFDGEVFQTLSKSTDVGVTCFRAPGPLVSPDMAMARPGICASLSRQDLRNNSTAVIAIEVKKLERQSNGQIARASGLDFNSTPPCGTVRAYDATGQSVDIKGFYLFACVEGGGSRGKAHLTAMALCDGDLLNADFKYYTDITGERTKDIGVGTYGDGANRNRPMVIFSNPLGAACLDRTVTLVHRDPDLQAQGIVKVGTITRTAVDGKKVCFTCYRTAIDGSATFDVTDPFPNPRSRSERTAGRGRFVLGIRPVS